MKELLMGEGGGKSEGGKWKDEDKQQRGEGGGRRRREGSNQHIGISIVYSCAMQTELWVRAEPRMGDSRLTALGFVG